MRSKIFFLILVLFASSIPEVRASDYGEDSTSLGQFTDDFENLNYVSVIDQVVRNSTYDALELNGTGGFDVYSNQTYQLKEQRRDNGYSVAITWSIESDEYLKCYSSAASYGIGWSWIMVDKDWMDGKYLRYRYKQSCQAAGKTALYCIYYNGTVDRNTGFETPGTNPSGKTYVGYFGQNAGVYDTWIVVDHEFNTSDVADGLFSIMFRLVDSYAAYWYTSWLDWVEINTGAEGAGNVWRIDFNGTQDPVSEVSGGYYDYGYVNNSGLPIQIGGFESEGYISTTDYLSGSQLSGSALTLLVNSTIPTYTELTVEFSSDNSSWVDHEGNSGSTELAGGFEAIDLRKIFYSAGLYLRYNFTTSYADNTPRLYQSRLISTQGSGVGGGTVESDAPWVALAIILSLIVGLLIWSVRH